MNLIETLLGTAARRTAKLETLTAKASELQAEYETAIAAGDDAEADKIAAKLQRTQAEIEAAAKVIETAHRQASAREAQAQRDEQLRGAQAYAEAWAAYEREAIRFDELVNGEVLAQWRLVSAQFEVARAAAIAARIERGSETPGHVWNVAFIRLLQGTQEGDKPPMVMPSGRSSSRRVETMGERFARKETRAAAEPQAVQ